MSKIRRESFSRMSLSNRIENDTKMKFEEGTITSSGYTIIVMKDIQGLPLRHLPHPEEPNDLSRIYLACVTLVGLYIVFKILD